MEEEWRKIEGTLNHYVSNLGNVKNFGTKNILKQQKDKDNYCYVSFRIPDTGRKLCRKQVHRLVGQAFIPNPENLPQIHHIDNNPSNNNVSNLRWVSNIENTQSKNRTCNIGFISSYFKNDKEYYVAGFRNYGNLYQKYSKDREICEEWLKNRRYEIKNGLEITKNVVYL
tara:strand:- start:692 stop:1201 length:510 start_codon:yes stop_codon:yes gene_type:complete